MAYFRYKKKTQPVTVLHVGIYSGFDFRMNRDLIFFKPRISDGSSTEEFERNVGERNKNSDNNTKMQSSPLDKNEQLR